MAALQQLLHQVLQLHEVGGRAKWVGEEDMEGKGGLYGKDKEKEEMHLGSGQQPNDVHVYCRDLESGLTIFNLARAPATGHRVSLRKQLKQLRQQSVVIWREEPRRESQRDNQEEVPAMEKDKIEKKVDGSKELKVIGAGLSRTGTLSTRYTLIQTKNN